MSPSGPIPKSSSIGLSILGSSIGSSVSLLLLGFGFLFIR